MRQVRVVLFDWDNTIVDSFDHLVRFHLAVGEQLGWPPTTMERIKVEWGKPFEQLIALLWPEHDSQQFATAYYQYILGQSVPVVPGAIEAITELERCCLLGIVTAAPRQEVEHFLTNTGLNAADFSLIQASGESEHHKPDPRVFDPILLCVGELGFARSQVLYIGDSLSDFYAARDAQLQFIAVLTGSTTRDEFRAAGLSHARIIPSIARLPAKLAARPTSAAGNDPRRRAPMPSRRPG